MILAAALMTVILISGIKGYSAFLVLTALLTAGLVALTWRFLHWPILLAIGGLFMVIIGVKPLFVGLTIVSILIPIVGKSLRLPGWKTALLVVLVAVSGYSVHLYLPIRSTQSPIINQNNPSEGVETTIRFLERQQYGSQGMVQRMFVRRAEWENQFGNYQRMGFWGFFHRQYGLTGPRFFILLILGLFGIWEVVRKRPRIGLFLLILLLITSVGLVLYMNFADGLRQDAAGRDHIEVRDRDYFFTPVFVVFGLALGIGVTMLVQFVREITRSSHKGIRTIIVASLCVLFLLPTYALAGNYNVCDRSRNYVPYDYARSLLTSCDENAVLFTGGDNDTFPVWCLQEVYGIRRDVKVVCLPLANTRWYIKQLRDDLGIDLGWTDQDIDQLRAYRVPDGRTFRIQDQVINAIIDNNRQQLPVNFGVVVGRGSRNYHGHSIDSLLEQSGLIFRLKGQGGGLRVDIDRSIDLYTDSSRFQYRGLNDPSVHKDVATIRASRNLANSVLIVLDALHRSGDLARLERLSRFLLQKIPETDEALGFLGTALLEQEKLDDLRLMIDSTKYGDVTRLRVLLARGLRRQQKPGEAEIVLKGILLDDAGYRPAFEELSRLYVAAHQYRALERLFSDWMKISPDDGQVEYMLEELKKRLAEEDNPGS
jgi:hypothetical protein